MYYSILLLPLVAFQSTTNFDSMIDHAILKRSSIDKFDVTVTATGTRVESISTQVKTHKSSYRIRMDGKDKIRVDRKAYTPDGAILHDYSICAGCVTDKRIFYHNFIHDGSGSISFLPNHVMAKRLIDPRFMGLEIALFETLSYTNPIETLRGAKYSQAKLDSKMGTITKLIRSQIDTPAIMYIYIDSNCDNQIVKIEFINPLDKSMHQKSQISYIKHKSGLFIPSSIIVDRVDKYFTFHEALSIDYTNIGSFTSAESFSPADIGLRYNTSVADMSAKKTAVKYFDGEKLVLHPPDPSKYYSDTRNQQQSSSKLHIVFYMASAILFLVAIVYYVKKVKR